MNSAKDKYEDLIVRHISEDTTTEEAATVRSLLKSDDDFRQLYREYKFIWEQASFTTDTCTQDWRKLRQRLGFETTKTRSSFSFLLRIAAVITLVLSVSGGLWVYWNVPGYGRWVVFETGAMSDSIVLPDESIVFLNRNSSLKFRNAFNGPERNVALSGQGYFEVTPDALKPFNVDLGPVKVKVVGTAFHLDATRKDGIIELNVTEGSVNLSNKREETTVNAGEWALAGDKVLGKGLAKDENFLAWKTGPLDFNKSSLKEIALALTRHFPEVDSFYIEGGGSDILVSTRFKGETLDEITEELSVHFQKKFVLNNGILIISD